MATGNRPSRGADLLRDCKRRGMTARCWPSRRGPWGSGGRCGRCSRLPRNNAAGFISRPMCLPLPKSAHPSALAAIKGHLQRRGHRQGPGRGQGVRRSTSARSTPRLSPRITDDLDTLLEFTTNTRRTLDPLARRNPIESTFATVRLRTRGHQGARITSSRTCGWPTKLIDAAQTRWRSVNARTWSPGRTRRGLPSRGKLLGTTHRHHPRPALSQAATTPEREVA